MVNFEDNIGLVHFVIHKSYNTYKDKEDLIQQGMIGLLKAINTFDKNKGCKFSTYAITCINNSIRTYLRKNKKQHINFSDLSDYQRDNLYEIKDRQSDSTTLKLLQDFNEFVISLKPQYKKIVEYRMKGLTQRQIGELENLSQAVISRILKQILSLYKRSCYDKSI